MAEQTDPITGKKAPDTATTYERAKPEAESPSKGLTIPPTSKPQQKDALAQYAKPAAKPLPSEPEK